MTRDRVLNIHTVNAALRRGLGRRGGVMSACRMLARVGNRPPRQPYSASTLTVSRCYERRGEERRVEQLYLSLSISLLSYSLPGCARVIVSTASSGSSPPSPEPLVLTPTPLVQLVLHPLSLSLFLFLCLFD